MNLLKTIAVSGLVLTVVALSGCSSTSTTAGTSNGPNDSGPVVAIISDVSGSTKPQRAPNGVYEQGWIDAATATALARGSLWAATADGQTLSSSTWQVNGRGFKESIEGNDLLAEAELKKQAEDMRPEARKILAVNRNGSDLLGALQAASRLFADYPDRTRALVLLTDGGLTEGINVAKNLPKTEAERKKAIKRLKGQGLIADLTGGSGEPVRVWIGGLGTGVGKSNPATTVAVIELWKDLIPAANGELVSQDSNLRLIGFP